MTIRHLTPEQHTHVVCWLRSHLIPMRLAVTLALADELTDPDTTTEQWMEIGRYAQALFTEAVSLRGLGLPLEDAYP